MIRIVDASAIAFGVMPGLDPGIPRLTGAAADGRDTPGHDRMVHVCHYTTPRSRN
jgi:hypothetical protein